MDKKEILKELLACVDLERLVVGLVVGKVVEPAILKLVQASDNKYDDMLAAALLPLIKENAANLVGKLKEGLQD